MKLRAWRSLSACAFRVAFIALGDDQRKRVWCEIEHRRAHDARPADKTQATSFQAMLARRTLDAAHSPLAIPCTRTHVTPRMASSSTPTMGCGGFIVVDSIRPASRSSCVGQRSDFRMPCYGTMS